jgi:5-(carboxyamino)imidazole ribonucleotide synthase
MEHLDYVGVLAFEFFVVDGQLLANEIAPRVHNSGHWTIEGAETSQFENHLRAITGLPLGSTRLRGASLMLNFIGELPPLPLMASIENLHVHQYGKTPKPLRKVGHATLTATSATALDAAIPGLKAALAVYL